LLLFFLLAFTLSLGWFAVVAWRWPSDGLSPWMQTRKAATLAAMPSPWRRAATGVFDPITSRRARPAVTVAAGVLLVASCIGLVVALGR
jgi:hypothetical protein